MNTTLSHAFLPTLSLSVSKSASTGQTRTARSTSGSTGLKNTEKEKTEARSLRDVRESWPMVTSSSLFAQVCQIVVLKIFHLGKPSVLVLKVILCLPGLSPLSGPVKHGWLVHPDSGQLVCPPEDVIRSRQGSWGFSQMQRESYRPNNQTVRHHSSIETSKVELKGKESLPWARFQMEKGRSQRDTQIQVSGYQICHIFQLLAYCLEHWNEQMDSCMHAVMHAWVIVSKY